MTDDHGLMKRAPYYNDKFKIQNSKQQVKYKLFQ